MLRLEAAQLQPPNRKGNAMVEFMRSATIVAMGAVVASAGVFVLVYGA